MTPLVTAGLTVIVLLSGMTGWFALWMRRALRRQDYLDSLARWPGWDWREEAKEFDAVIGVRIRWYGPRGCVYITWGRGREHAERRVKDRIGSWTRHLQETRDLA